VYDTANRLQSVGGVTYTPLRGAPRVWDANGNLLNDGATSYTFDHANRLKTAGNASYTHPFGCAKGVRRGWKTAPARRQAE
jgi:hypothetical protein